MNEQECVILFWPPVNQEDKIEDFNRISNTLTNLKEKPIFEDLNFGWVNSTCHGDMLERIEYDKTKTPVLIYFWPHRTAYATFDHSFQNFPLEEFVRKGREQRISTKRILRHQISITNRNCGDPNSREEEINDVAENNNEKKENTQNDNNNKKDQRIDEVNLDDNGKKNDL